MIQIDLPDRVHALATKLKIALIMEIGPELISLEGVFGNKRLVWIARLEIPGFNIPGEYPGPLEACIELIKEANGTTT